MRWAHLKFTRTNIELTIHNRKIEERPDILASRRFLPRIDARADRQTTAVVSGERDNTQEISRRLTAGGHNGGRARRCFHPRYEICPPNRIKPAVQKKAAIATNNIDETTSAATPARMLLMKIISVTDVLLNRILITVPVTASCPGFDLSLTHFSSQV